MADELKRIEVGFDGGQVIALRLAAKELERLRGSLEKGGWLQLATEEATVDIDAGEVVFVRTAGDEHKVGF